jgi:hypothetical protein
MAPDAELTEVPARVAAGEHVVMRPSKRRKLGSLLLGLWAVFMAAAGAIAITQTLAGLIFLIPAAPFALYWLAVALPRSGALTLTRRGFEVRHAWITRRWDWDRVTGFGVRQIIYPRGGGIDLVTFSTDDPRDRPGDFLQQLAVRGLTRTSTLPDRFGKDPEDLAGVMSQCRVRFSDGAGPEDAAAIATDVQRSTVMNAVVLVAVWAVMTSGSLFMAMEAQGAERVVGWIGVVFFGVGGVVAAVLRRVRGDRAEPAAASGDQPIEIDANEEVTYTAATSGVSAEIVNRVLEAHYDYLERHPRGRVVEDAAEYEWIADRTGVDLATVRRLMSAHDDFLRQAGVLTDA